MTTRTAPRRENLWLSIICNMAVPALILTKGGKMLGWSPALVLVVALAFPVGYFLYDLKTRGKRNFIAIIGFIGTLITGAVGLLHLSKEWIAIKEAAIHGLFGLAVLGSMFTKRPLVRAFLLNPDFFDVDLIERAVDERGTRANFDKLLRRGTLLLAVSFFFSGALNYALARYIVTADSGTDLFNNQIGRMQWLSWPVVVVPVMAVTMYALFVILKGIERDTGLKLEDIALHEEKKDAPAG